MKEAETEWIREHLPLSEEDRKTVMVTLEALKGNGGGLSGCMKVVNVCWPNDKALTFVIKNTSDNGFAQSKTLGLYREALFYQKFANEFQKASIPLVKVYYAKGDADTGERTLMMEDLREKSVLSGYFFGSGSPLNWGRDLSEHLKRLPSPLTAFDVAKRTFQEAAKMHRRYWLDPSLLQHDWLRGRDWIQGRNQESWEMAQRQGKESWMRTQKRIAESNCQVEWDQNLFDCMSAAMNSVDWKKFQSISGNRPWTLVHGDFHPGNIMWVFEPQGYPLMLDWEMVGLGNGAQDLSQYLISHANPDLRREIEEDLLRLYYDVLVDQTLPGNPELSPGTYSYDQCKHDYVEGGARRWIWLLAILCEMCPDSMNQYFADQTAAFLRDHGLHKGNIGMPQV
mmetsp:Transcript_8105/g.27186  ORF Transcript_8105/g.27186 Transcript_8105/m.27186 type:complete len:396 (+) Transcript_8105:203-1390(+)